MTQQLLIPPKIKVGFRKRDGTYTGKLAYVIYYDMKGNLRKETSWQSWRDHKISPVDFDNVPTEGFVLNKGVGGQRASYGWNARNEYIRVYDPRDFEFEISVANLLFILRECNCSKGKGLEGQFVYAWDGKELVLLPIVSEDYKNSAEFTALKTQKVKSRELIKGAAYLTQGQEIFHYIGKFNKYCVSTDRTWGKPEPAVAEKYIFWGRDDWQFLNNLNKIAKLQSDVVMPNYAEIVDKYNKSRYGSKPVSLSLRAANRRGDDYNRPFAIEEKPGVFLLYRTSESCGRPVEEGKINSLHVIGRVQLVDNVIKVTSLNVWSYRPGVKDSYSWLRNRATHDWFEPTFLELRAKLESGSEYTVTDSSLYDKKD